MDQQFRILSLVYKVAKKISYFRKPHMYSINDFLCPGMAYVDKYSMLSVYWKKHTHENLRTERGESPATYYNSMVCSVQTTHFLVSVTLEVSFHNWYFLFLDSVYEI